MDDQLDEGLSEEEEPVSERTSEMKRILVVDDCDQNRQFIAEIVEDLGHQLYQAVNGEEALRFLDAHQVDLILLDIMMPGKSGLFVFKEIKKRKEHAHTPIIIITGASDVTGVQITSGEADPIQSYSDQHPRSIGARIHQLLSGISPDALIEKPVDPEALLITIRRLLNEQPRWFGEGI